MNEFARVLRPGTALGDVEISADASGTRNTVACGAIGVRAAVVACAEVMQCAQRCERAQRCGRAAGSASLRRSPRSGDCPALLDPRSHRGTRFVRCAHCAQTAAMSQMTKRVLRTRRPRACAARRRRGAAPAAHPHLCVNRGVVLVDRPTWFFAKPWAGGRPRASAAPRSAGARGLRIAARRGVERSLSEHRAQAACAAGCRPCEGEFCARPRAPSTAGQSARRDDRRSEARPATRPRLCDAQT